MELRCKLLDHSIRSLDKSLFQKIWTFDRGLFFFKVRKYDSSRGFVFVSIAEFRIGFVDNFFIKIANL